MNDISLKNPVQLLRPSLKVGGTLSPTEDKIAWLLVAPVSPALICLIHVHPTSVAISFTFLPASINIEPAGATPLSSSNFELTAPVEISGTEQEYNISSAFLVFSTSVR